MRYAIVRGREIVRHGFAGEKALACMFWRLKPGQRIVGVPDDVERVDDVTMEWDPETETFVARQEAPPAS